MRPFVAVLLLLAPLCTYGQSQPEGLNFVMPHGPGKITVTLTDGWTPQSIALYDEGTRPVIGTVNKATKLDASYILFPNDTGAATAESCRDAVVDVILKSIDTNGVIKDQNRTTRTLKDGRSIAVATYLLAKMGDMEVKQQELFGFFGDKNTCAEIHISKALATPADVKLFDTAVERFAYSPDYTPTSQDYGSMATLLFANAHDPKAAAYFYRSALDTLPDTEIAGYDAVTLRRVLTDQLSMSYGMSGDLKRSREVNEAAITKDPLYPLYYYDLACADAEAGNAAAARTHLEQAYARRANILKGETMPDASKDDSILKLKSNKEFWAFVESLPKN